MTIYSVISGWLGGSTPAKLDGTAKDTKHTIRYGMGGTFANKTVTAETTMQLSTAWACTRLNARTVGSLPLKLYRRDGALHRQADEEHSLHFVLSVSPNPDQGPMEFWEGMIACLNLRGNAYARIGRRSDGQVNALWPLNPDAVSVFRNGAGLRCYRVAGAGELGSSDVFHLRGFGAGGDLGLSPISYGRQTIASALASEEVAGSTFSSGLQAAGFVEMATGTKLDNKQRLEIAEMFEKFAGSGKVGKVMPLDPGMKFHPLKMTAADAQLLESRRFSVEEICRWFGVFPILIGHAAQGQTMWGSGVEQIMLAWRTLGLGPELTRIEQAVMKQLLSPEDRRKLYVEFIDEGLLRADSAGRAALYSSFGQNGVMKRNEMRAKENLAPDDSPGANMLTVQSNMIPLDMIGQQPAAPTPAGPSSQSDIEALIDARVKAALLGHSGGPRLESGQ